MAVSIRELHPNQLHLRKELGKGSFGVVYKATCTLDDRDLTVAFKQLIAPTLSPEAQKEFLTEIAVMAGLQHRNIVPLVGYCRAPRGIAMGYMRKGCLTNILQNKSEPLDWPLRIRIAHDMASGLACLHENRVLHRDIKSLNVLLDNDYVAKLSDFGLSKIKAETRTMTAPSTQTLGTIAWMAPELFALNALYRSSCDVYSLGITFWELASRTFPYFHSEQAAIPFFVQQGQREEIPRDCPRKFANLIKACWNGDPNRRPKATDIVAFLTSSEESWPGSSETKHSPSMNPSDLRKLGSQPAQFLTEQDPFEDPSTQPARRLSSQPAESSRKHRGQTDRSVRRYTSNPASDEIANAELKAIELLRQKHRLEKQIEQLEEQESGEDSAQQARFEKTLDELGKIDARIARQGASPELCAKRSAVVERMESINARSTDNLRERIKRLRSQKESIGPQLDALCQRFPGRLRLYPDLYQRMLREESS